MAHNVTVIYKDKEYASKVENGTNLLDHIRKLDVPIDTPCGGNGTCGKCRVRTSSGTPMSEKEAKLLGRKAIENGYRLACYQSIESDLEVTLDDKSADAAIMTSVKDINTFSDPAVCMRHITISAPTLSDQRANISRILDQAEKCMDILDLDLVYKIDNFIKNRKYELTAVSYRDQLIDVAEGWIEKIYSLAVDIGTTTVAVYLVDTIDAKIVDVDSFMNPQKKYGADVISRIDHINKSRDLGLLSTILIKELNESAAKLSERNRIIPDHIYSIYFAGNTTMIHILLTLDPGSIANAPFIPQTTKAHTAKSVDYGIEINRKGVIVNLPMVSGYVGADTIGALISSGMYEKPEMALLIDLGTNGEIVIGNEKFLASCSAAAGPAFEGANIRNGMAGIPGAIDRVWTEGGEVKYTTIGDAKPEGLCGSAIVDAVAVMIDKGIIDETGRFTEAGGSIGDRVRKIEGMDSFVIYEDDVSDEIIAVTQKDIREVQNAKAAIAAGIQVLLDTKGIKAGEIEKVYLAGGFGSFINKSSAVKIGLFPKELENSVYPIGNAAGAGAVMCSITCGLMEEAIMLSESIEYVELSSNPDFIGHYMEEMLFG